MAASLKESGQCFACGLILFPASLTSGVRGDKDRHLRSGSTEQNNNKKLEAFLKQCSHLFVLTLEKNFWLFHLRTQMYLYLRVGAEHMTLHFVHGVHAIRHSPQVKPPEHHFILGQRPW